MAGLCIAGAGAELGEWVQHLPNGTLLWVFFRTAGMPGGDVQLRRPPAETRDALSKMIAGSPRDAALYRLRAHEAELAEDFTAAEADWRRYAELAPDSAAANLELADFYHRRMRPHDEVAALLAVTRDKGDLITSVTEQRPWKAFERMMAVAENDGLSDADALRAMRAWVARYPRQPAPYERLVHYLSAHHQYAGAEQAIAAYARVFHDDLYPVRARAELELDRGNADAAIRVYDDAFQPLWPDDMMKSWFQLLDEQHRLRDFVGRARAALQTNPADLNATARLFHYYRSQNNAAAARRALVEHRLAKESGSHPWTPNELLITAQLFERLPDVNEAARLWYALYSAPGAGAANQERALFELSELLLTQADQPVRFGSGDLSFYKDVATIDSSPGFLNGILSLILNDTGPRWAYREQNAKSAPYFHRAEASQLASLLEQRYPQSRYREPLRAGLVQAYATYGDDNAVIEAGREYLAMFPRGERRFSTGMLVADALARQNRLKEEFALYNQFLRELAAYAHGQPVGSTPKAEPRSPEYVQVLDRYLSRLAAIKRSMDALRVYRAEIDRNPNDPGLYERLAAFLDQNDMTADVVQTYRAAMARFSDRSWYDKLARWYLRHEQNDELEKITEEAVGIFSGTELERYFSEVVGATAPHVYLQLNLYAHNRFPEDLVFVNNLIGAYSRPETANSAAAERLYREYWFYDDALRTSFFRYLAANGRLYPELDAVRKANPDVVAGRPDPQHPSNFAAAQFAAEAEIWLSHFEAAAPIAGLLADASPGEKESARRASSLYRSLAAYSPEDTGVAVHFAEAEYRAEPRDREMLARIGDIYADRGQFARARPYWNRMPQIEAARPDGWLDAATVYWDYYLFDDALRLISGARRRFNNPALFAYQAGAIDENRRQYSAAVEQYVAGALAGDEQCTSRLERLASRSGARDLVDNATATAAHGEPSWASISLRITVLEKQQRRPDLESLLALQIAAQKSQATLEQLAAMAQSQGFDALQVRALSRQIELSNDPVEKMRLGLALMRLEENRKDIAAAARTVDTLWRDHPEILSVIRGAVDFHVRNKQPAEAVAILLDAAKRARRDLAQQFTFEAARIDTDAGNFGQARGLLSQLLSSDPYRADYLTAMAETYLRANDDRGYRDYELATIDALKKSPLTPAERTEHIAAIRRSLIPALTRMNDFAGAVDQYIEVINRYPEDEDLAREAAIYAMSHGQSAKLVTFYRKTISNALRDYRWPIVSARIETVMENYPAAIADYDLAMKARPDRSDIVEARANLEDRLMRFADAERSYLRLYDLSYHAPEWLARVAEERARLGRRAECVDSLKTAVIGAHAETSEADFEIAERLESWRMTDDAVAFAERGAQIAGADLFTAPFSAQAQTYARIMTEARHYDVVLSRVDPAAKNRADVSQAVGAVVAELYTPEEKAAFENALTTKAAAMNREQREALLLPFATSAGLVALESRWRLDAMMQRPQGYDARFTAVETERGRYRELAQELEQYAARFPAEGSALAQAATAWIAEGDVDGQLRVMQTLARRNAPGGAMLDRYLSLLAALHPDQLVQLAASAPSADVRNRAVQWAIGSGNRELAYRAIQARGAQMRTVWTRAYTALAGVYFADPSPAATAAFTGALDTRTIGERVSSPPDRNATLAGSVWFYYGARYGEYLDGQKNARAADYLPASVEDAPESADRYLALGDYYESAHQPERALAEYALVLQIDADRGDAYDHMARVQWNAGRRDEAVVNWRAAIAAFKRLQSKGVRVPQSFWAQETETFHDIGECHTLAILRGDMQRLLLDYISRNGSYELDALLTAAFRASLVSGGDTSWVFDLADKTDNPEYVIASLMQVPNLTDAQRISLERKRSGILEREVAGLYGDERVARESQLTARRLELIEMLLDEDEVQQASAEWNKLPAAPGLDSVVEIRLASRTGALSGVLQRYRSKPEGAPTTEVLRRAAEALRRDKQETAALSVLDFLYTRELDAGRLDAANFLGLAEVRLEQKNNAAALQFLHRMALVTDKPFDTLPAAADLLEKYNQPAAAAEFVAMRLRAAPWDSSAKLHAARLVQGSRRQELLRAVVADPLAAYRDRADAALLSAPAAPAGTELSLLSAGSMAPAEAEKPFYVEARIKAAESSGEAVREQLYCEALAIDPANQRVRHGVLRAALSLRHDSLALALAQKLKIESPSVAEQLGAAAERLGDLAVSAGYLQTAIDLLPEDQRGADETKLKAINAEQTRRSMNVSRQPVVRNVVDQQQTVKPEIPR